MQLGHDRSTATVVDETEQLAVGRLRSIARSLARRVRARYGFPEPKPERPGYFSGQDLTPSVPLVELVYELLDAHDDTSRLATELVNDPNWITHLFYLQQLQRVGREMLARAGPEQIS